MLRIMLNSSTITYACNVNIVFNLHFLCSERFKLNIQYLNETFFLNSYLFFIFKDGKDGLKFEEKLRLCRERQEDERHRRLLEIELSSQQVLRCTFSKNFFFK
jgi:hypothetical protein